MVQILLLLSVQAERGISCLLTDRDILDVGMPACSTAFSICLGLSSPRRLPRTGLAKRNSVHMSGDLLDLRCLPSVRPHPKSVDAVAQVYLQANSTPYRGACAHYLSASAAAAQDSARAVVASFVRAPRASEIVFAPSTSVAWHLLACGLKPLPGQADEVLIATSCADDCYQAFVNATCNRTISIDCNPDTRTVDFVRIAQNLSTKTKAVVLNLVDEDTGFVHDFSEIIQYIRSAGSSARVILDVRLAVGRIPVTVTELDCDFAVGDSQGVSAAGFLAFIYGRTECLEQICPMYGADESFSEVTLELHSPDHAKKRRRPSLRRSLPGRGSLFGDPAKWMPLPYRLEAGMPLLSSAAAFAGAIEAMRSRVNNTAVAGAQRLAQLLEEELESVDGVSVVGQQGTPADDEHVHDSKPRGRIGIVSFTASDVGAQALARELRRKGIWIDLRRHSARKKALLPPPNTSETLRVSFADIHAEHDVKYLAHALQATCRKLAEETRCQAHLTQT